MADLARIKRNVAKMVGMKAPESEIDAYIAQEGVTLDDVRNFKLPPAATPPTGAVPGSREYADWAVSQVRAGNKVPDTGTHTNPSGRTGILDKITAGYTSAVNAIPIAGPAMMGGLNQAKGALYGVPAEQIAADNAATEQANPITSTIGSVAGTVLPFMGAGLIPGVGRALGMTGGIGSRIVAGGVSGMGINAADTAVRGGDTQDMAQSGAIGLGLGAALPIVGRGVGAVTNKALGRSVPKEAKALSRALKDDNIAPADVNSRLAGLGDGSMVMDLGPNLQRQAGAIASVPGKGQKTVRDAVAGRQQQAGARVEGDVTSTLGNGPELNAMQEQVVAAQKAAAKPLYDAVRNVNVLPTGNMKVVFGTPMGKEAFKVAQRMAANDGASPNNLTVGLIDYTKRALDDIASSAARAGRNNEARQARQMAKLLTAEADKAVPGYKAARDAFAGPAQVLDAMEAGSNVFGKEMTPGQLQSSLQAMTASERDAFIQAARASIQAQMGNAVNEALSLRNLFKKGWNEQKLRIILGPKVADDLMARINREAVFGQTSNVVTGNSETAARAAAQGEVAPQLARTERPQGLTGMVFSAFDAARAALRGKTQPKINEKLAGLHTADILSAEQIKQLEQALKARGTGWLGPAVPGLLTGPNKPLEITVSGGASTGY